MGYKKDSDSEKEFIYKIFDDFIFDERGSSFLALRRISWGGDDQEKAKWDLRKWCINENNTEIPLKGFTFLTPEGPNDLTETLIKNGFGDTKNILKELKSREDFKESVEHMYDDNTSSDEFFDARKELLTA